MQQERNPSDPKEPKPADSFLKFGNFALQLLGGIGVAAWLGHWLDQYLHLAFPVFMLGLGFLVFGGMLYQAYRNLNAED